MENDKGIEQGMEEGFDDEDDDEEVGICPYGADRPCLGEDCVCCGVYNEWLFDACNPPEEDCGFDPLDPFGDECCDDDEW